MAPSSGGGVELVARKPGGGGSSSSSRVSPAPAVEWSPRSPKADAAAAAAAATGGPGAAEPNKTEPLGRGHRSLPSLSESVALSTGTAPERVGLYRRGVGRMLSTRPDGDEAYFVSPDSPWLFAWKVVVLALAVFQAVTVPYRAVFGFDGPWAWFAADMACDACFLADIAVSFVTAYWEAGRLVTDREQIRRHYLEGSFALDVVASLPLGLAQLATGWQTAWRLNRVLRLSDMVRMLGRSENDPETSMAAVRIVRLVCYTLLLSHFVGCLWFAFGLWQGFGSDDWVPSEELHASGRWSQYLRSLHFALGTMKGVSVHDTTAGDLPNTAGQSLFTTGVMFSGVVLFAYIVGSIDNVVDVARDNYAAFHQITAATTRFMNTHGLSADLQERVRHYYAYMWDRTHGFHRSNPMMDRLDRLPSVLRADMAAALPARILANTPLFQGLEEGFVAGLVNSLEQRLCTPGEFVFHAGDLGDDVYFIVGGRISVLVGPMKVHVATLYPGDSFGSYGALLHQPRTAYARAQTYCDLLYISKERLNTVLDAFPDAKAAVQARVRDSRATTLENEKTRGVEASTRRTTARSMKRGHHFGSPQGGKIVGDPSAAVQDSVLGGAAEPEPSSFRPAAAEPEPSSFKAPPPAAAAAAAAAPAAAARADPREVRRARIMPVGRRYWAWQTAVAVAGAYMALSVPFRAAFVFYNTDNDTSAQDAVDTAFDAVFDLLLAVSVALRFTTGYAKNGHLVYELGAVRRHYLRTSFWPHLVATLPLDWLAAAATGERNPAWRLPRLLWLAETFRVIAYAVNHSSRHTLVRLGRLFLTILLLAHTIACVYFSFTYHEGYSDDEPWLLPPEFRDSSVASKYARSLFFALALLTGSGKVPPPSSDLQILFTMTVLLVGIFVVATVISGVAALVSNLDTFATEHHKDHRFVVQYMRFHNLPRPFFTRVQAVFDQYWSQEKGVDPNRAFEQLPMSLRSEVLMQIYGSIIRDIPLFEFAPDEFIQMLSASVSLQVFPEGEYVYRRGHLGDTMFFVVSGKVNIMLPVQLAPEPAGGGTGRRQSLFRNLMGGGRRGTGARHSTSSAGVSAARSSVTVEEVPPSPRRSSAAAGGLAGSGAAAAAAARGERRSCVVAGAPNHLDLPGAVGGVDDDEDDGGDGPDGVEATGGGGGGSGSFEHAQPDRRPLPQPHRHGLSVKWGAEVDEVAFMEMERGCFFGESVMLDSPNREASARAETLCNVLVLRAADFKRVFEPTPEMMDDLRAVARSRLTLASKLADRMAVRQPPSTARRTVQSVVNNHVARAMQAGGLLPAALAVSPRSLGGRKSSLGLVVRRESVMNGVEDGPPPAPLTPTPSPPPSPGAA